MKRILAIDPGSEKSAYVIWDGSEIVQKGIVGNDEMLLLLDMDLIDQHIDCLVIEKVECYGMPVGATTFDTVFWSGRFVQAWGVKWEALPRRAVKLYLCGSMRAKDANIRQAILDKFGGRKKAIGLKASPGPLHGVKSHLWAALALALTWTSTNWGN
jgi:hypothetical protein